MRSKGIGGTDIAAIVGLNPWRGPIDVYMEKIGLTEPEPDNEAKYWGRELEAAVLRRYAKETGLPVYTNSEVMVGEEEWILGTPDALVEPKGGVDAKTTGRPDDWADGPPDYVSCQCHWYMGLTGAQWWDVALLILSPRREFKIFRIERDQEVIDELVRAGRDFWFNHVLPQAPPPLDGSTGASEYLKLTYPRDLADVIAAPPEAQGLVEELVHCREMLLEFETAKAHYENQLKALIGDAAGLVGQGWKITWKKSKDLVFVDWQQAYMDLCAYVHDKGLLINDEEFSGKHTAIKPGPRVFRVAAFSEAQAVI